MSLRARRLTMEYQQLAALVQRAPYLQLVETRGTPPDRYVLEYAVQGLERNQGGYVSLRKVHRVEIYLTHAYPRQAPQCRMQTPVFHPNIAPHAICIADHWTAGEQLSDLVVRIGQMLALQAYNTKSPLDGDAARWVEENLVKLPIDRRDLHPPDPDAEGAVGCAGCGRPLGVGEVVTCTEGHIVCAGCARTCPECGAVRCTLCDLQECPQCHAQACPDCVLTCPGCWTEQCKRHLEACAVCGTEVCQMCGLHCRACGKPFCADHAEALSDEERPRCEDCRRTQSTRAAIQRSLQTRKQTTDTP